MTRADMIRFMTDEKMAEFLYNCFGSGICCYCKLFERCMEMAKEHDNLPCVEVYLEYLDEEV